MDKELQHHGILGQRWGIRRYQNPDGTLTAAGRKRLVKEDSKWEKNATRSSTYVKIYNNAANAINSKIPDFNKKYEQYDFRDPKNKKVYDRYLKEYGKMWNDILQKSADEFIGTNPSGTKKAIAYAKEVGGSPVIEFVDLHKK